MKKRLRKKLRVGEFQELGFAVRFRLPGDLNESGMNAFWDAFIIEVVEAGGFMFGGACGHEWDVFVCRPNRQSATEADRQAIASWLGRHEQVSDILIGPLVDAWYGG